MADPQLRSLPVPDGLEGERLDAGLARLLGLSRSRAAELAADGRVSVDGEPVGKSERLRAGAWLEVELPPPPPAAAGAPTAADRAAASASSGGPALGVVHDDDDLVVVDKPVGIAAHPSPGWTGPTVVGVLAASGYRVATSGAAERQGVVHRLDVGTSGLMVVAKTERAYAVLKAAFRERTVEKTYHALVQGHPDPSSGTVDAPIGRHPTADHRFAVVSAQAGGKDSVTHYETLEAFAAASLLAVRLETGRTHQIRVHFAALRHPCVGDLTYGADPRLAQRLGVSRQWLHAVGLGFDHPATGERVRFTSVHPADLAAALERLAGS